MRISEMLMAIASWLESSDNEAMLLSEYDDDCLAVVASSCIEAAEALKKAASVVDQIEPPKESVLTPEALDDLCLLADALDSSTDPALKKQASVIDELLLTISSPPGVMRTIQAAQDAKIEEFKKKYENPRKELESINQVDDAKKAIDKSNMTKQYNVLEAPLSSRYCPDHAGAQISRIGEHTWQCELDKKVYNFDVGFELNNGSKVPGGDVSNQSTELELNPHSIFDSRESISGNR